MSSIDVDLRGLPEVQAMLAQFQGGQLNNRMRRALRAGIAVFRAELRAEASSGGFPRSFRKTRTRPHRNPLGVSVSPASPLSTVFERGAKSHAIAPKRGSFLASQQGAAPFFARGSVKHPGMKARPLSGPVFDANQGKAEDAVTTALFEGIR